MPSFNGTLWLLGARSVEQSSTPTTTVIEVMGKNIENVSMFSFHLKFSGSSVKDSLLSYW